MTHQPSHHSRLSNQSGYVIHFVVILLMIIAIFATMSTYNANVAARLSVRDQQSVQARHLAQSGVARTQFFLNGGEGRDLSWETDSFVEAIAGYGSITLACRRIGLLDWYSSTGKRIQSTTTIAGAVARQAPDTLAAIITLTGRIRGLLVDNKTHLSGQVVLADGSVVYGERRRALPGSQKWTRNRASPPFPFRVSVVDSAVNAMGAALSRWVKADSFTGCGSVDIGRQDDSLLLRDSVLVRGDCRLRGVNVTNKRFLVGGTLSVEAGTVCDRSVFYATRVTLVESRTSQCLVYSKGSLAIGSGSHASQFFSDDTITIGAKCRFGDPTLWVSRLWLAHDTIPHGGIRFETGGTYNGVGLAYTDSTRTPATGRVREWAIQLAQSTVFRGYLVTDGSIEVPPGRIEGHLWAADLRGIDGDKKMTNCLYSVAIKKIRKPMAFPLIGEKPVRIVVIGAGESLAEGNGP